MDKDSIKIDAETKQKISDIISSEATQLFIKSVKEAGDTGTFRVMITTDDIDRMGEMVKTDGWDFTNYLKSPVVLWGHNYNQPPIGVCTSLLQVGNGWQAEGKFAPTEFAQGIRQLYDLGMCRATSVGFIPLEQTGNVIEKAELLEFSFVSVPANPYALALRDIYGVSQETALMVTKSIINNIKTMDTKDKGAVADEITAENNYEMKCDNMEDVWEVISAFCQVYFDDTTAVEDFGKLLTETITILQTVADGSYVDPDDADMEKSLVAKNLKTEKTKTLKVALESIASKEDNGSERNAGGEAPVGEEVVAGGEGGADLEAGTDENTGADVEPKGEDEDNDIDTDPEAKDAKALLAFQKRMQFAVTVISEALADARKATKKNY